MEISSSKRSTPVWPVRHCNTRDGILYTFQVPLTEDLALSREWNRRFWGQTQQEPWKGLWNRCLRSSPHGVYNFADPTVGSRKPFKRQGSLELSTGHFASELFPSSHVTSRALMFLPSSSSEHGKGSTLGGIFRETEKKIK